MAPAIPLIKPKVTKTAIVVSEELSIGVIILRFRLLLHAVTNILLPILRHILRNDNCVVNHHTYGQNQTGSEMTFKDM